MDELQNIQNLIYVIRGQRVMLDFDLSKIYQVETKYLKRQVRRNIERFEGDDFMFEVSQEEILRCQNVTSSWGGSRYGAFAFTEIGDTLKPYSPTLSQILYPVATTTTRIRLYSWNQPKIPVPLHQ